MYKSNLYRYNESSEEEDSSDDEHIAPAFVKSAVFNNNQKPLIKSGSYEPKKDEINNQVEEEQSHLRPRLKVQEEPVKCENKSIKYIQNTSNKCIQNVSGLMSVKNHSISQANIHKKAVNAAYTFKLKSPNPAKKKNDPVALFQQTNMSWKKDKFLTSRTDLKEGRKLQLQKRNKMNV